MAKSWIQHEKRAICIVDWRELAIGSYCTAAKRNTKIVGSYMAQMIKSQGIKPIETVLVGHSLGAHISGICGHELGSQIKIIYGKFSRKKNVVFSEDFENTNFFLFLYSFAFDSFISISLHFITGKLIKKASIQLAHNSHFQR